MASQTVPAAKRYRISLLLDTYSALLTEKQQTFLRHYYEEDLSFGEIAKEYGVSRQAIFDSVKHGEESLENFERVLNLVEGGWARLIASGRTVDELAERLEGIRAKIAENNEDEFREAALQELGGTIAELRGEAVEGDLDEEQAAQAQEPQPALEGNGSAHV